MRKRLSVISIIVVAGILSISYYMAGVRAEKEFTSFIQTINKFPNLRVTADHYHRGWLRSTVRINVVVHKPAQSYIQEGIEKVSLPQDIPLSFEATIYHGPLIITDHSIALGLGYLHSNIALPDNVLAEIDPTFTKSVTPPTLVFSLLLKYNQQLNITLDIPSFELLTSNNQGHFFWNGLTSQWQFASALTKIKGFVTFKGMSFQKGLLQGKVGPMHLKYVMENKGTPEQDELFLGEASLDFKKIEVISNKVTQWAIEGFQAISQNQVHDNLVDSSLKVDVNTVTFHDSNYGPGVLNMALHNLDATATHQIQQQIQEAGSHNLTEAQQQVLMWTLLSELPALLSKGAELEVKQFQLSLPEGLLLTTAQVGLTSQNAANQNFLQLINKIHATVAAEAPASWLKSVMKHFYKIKIKQNQQIQIAQDNPDEMHAMTEGAVNNLAEQQATDQLTNLVQEGFLKEQNGIYSIEIVFQDGLFMVNGKPFHMNMQH